MLAQITALTGADILGGIGQLECATVFSPVQAVLDNEIGAMVRKLIEKPVIDEHTDKLVADRTVNQCRRYRRVNPARQPTDHPILPNPIPDQLDL